MGWINAGILAGFAALAIPIIIHLLRNLRYKPAELGTLRFLRMAMQESMRRRKLRELLLLIARLIMVSLLVMLFARPFFEDPNKDKNKYEVIMLLDASGSMHGMSLGARNYDLTKIHLKNYLEKLPATAKVTLAAFSDDVKEFDTLDALKIKSGGKTDYAKALEWARKKLKDSKRSKKRIIMFTDLQSEGLPKEAFKSWPSDVPVEIKPTTAAGDFNIAINSVRNLTPYMGHQGPLEIDIRCYTAGNKPKGEMRVDVTLEGEGDKPVELSATVPIESQRVQFKWLPHRTGQFRGKVKITTQTPDVYSRDDSRSFVFVVRKPHPVLLYNGKKGESRFQDETYYLQKALEVAPRDEAKSAFFVEKKEFLPELKGYQTVALCNMGNISSPQAKNLKKFVENGGGLIYFLGDQTTGTMCNMLRNAGIFPASWVSKRAAIPRKVSSWDGTHEAIKLFADPRKGNLERIVFNESFELEADEDAKTLVTLDSGNPAIIDAKLGKGRIMIVTNSVYERWKVERIYLPVMRELFIYLAGNFDSSTELKERYLGIAEQRKVGIYDKPETQVVVPNPAESAIQEIDEDSFRSRLNIGPAPLESLAMRAKSDRPQNSRRKDEIWLYLILALLAVVVLENILADRGQV